MSPFTYAQEPEVERLLSALCESVCDIVRRTVDRSDYVSLLLIGGYGRGEGGVQPTPSGPRPHNNLDFLLITNTDSQAATRIAEQLNKELCEVRKAFSIGVDLSAIAAKKLRSSSCLVMWYDMRYGHKTLLGDADFVPSLSQFEAERIPAWNARDLLVNRGTLLLLNRWMNRQFEASMLGASHAVRAEARRKLDLIAVRHLIKAIIGYGDTLLYFDGKYHWSYAEKLQRMKQCRLADQAFIDQYVEAASFRFIADYDAILGEPTADKSPAYTGRDLVQWQDEVTEALCDVHLRCESLRLKHPLVNWADYAELASRAVLCERWQSPTAWARKLAFCAKYHTSPRNAPLPGSTRARWGLQAAGPRSRLSLAFPIVAYGVGELDGWARQLIDGRDQELVSDLLATYVERWGEIGDTNFSNFANHIGEILNQPTRLEDSQVEEVVG